MDQFDRRILALVQADNRLPVVEIAERIGLSKSAVQRRLAAMRRSGIVEANVAVLDPEAVGPYLAFILLITLETDKPQTMASLVAAMKTTPEVQQCYHVTGGTDFIAVVYVRNQRHFAELTRKLLYDNPHVARFESCLVVERSKVGLQLPIDS